jgi:diguanylate cyclase (GGDEF)-like protein
MTRQTLKEAQISECLVLIVDDDPTVRLIGSELLSEAGFIVVEAEDGRQALAAFEHFKPDIVLMDFMMSITDGFEVCALIRRRPHGDNAAILVITGLEDLKLIDEAYLAGATDFVTKPINWLIMIERLRHIWSAVCGRNELRKNKDENRALINAMPDLILNLTKDGTILDCKAPKDFDLSPFPEKLPGRNISEVLSKNNPEKILSSLENSLKTGEIQILEHQVPHGDEIRSYESRIVTKVGDELLLIVRDISQKKRDEQRMFELEHHDSLTGLLNRYSFEEHLNKALAQTRRSGRFAAVLHLDLDGFKLINNTLGHNIGDLLLQGVADRLVKSVRMGDRIARLTTDTAPTAVARLGGDEFLVLLTDIGSVRDAAVVARRMMDKLSEPFLIEDQELFATASIGIAVSPGGGEDVDTILSNADAALKHAKDLGRNNFQFFTSAMRKSTCERFAAENKLRRTLDCEKLRSKLPVAG